MPKIVLNYCFVPPRPKSYSLLPREAVLVNLLGLFIVLFAGLVVHLVSHGPYKRRSTEEDMLLAAGAYME